MTSSVLSRGLFSTGVFTKTGRISFHSTLLPTGVARAFHSGGERAKEKRLHRAYTGGEMDGEKDTDPLELHVFSACSRSAANKGLNAFLQGLSPRRLQRG